VGDVVSTAALLPNGSCDEGSDGATGSRKGSCGVSAALAAPSRSHELLGRSEDGDGSFVADATASRFPPLLLLSANVGENWVTGRRLRRGAVELVRTLGAGSITAGGGGDAFSCMAIFSLSGFVVAAVRFLLRA
jgi:hypothetical protein